MPMKTLSNFVLHPELKLTRIYKVGTATTHLHCEKQKREEYCPRCATQSKSTYDTRRVQLKDAPIRGAQVILLVRKRRLWCKPCKKPFTESLPGVRKKQRHTDRYARSLLWACENFSNLSQVKKAYRCSTSFLYRVHYQKLEAKLHERGNYPWSQTIGIDEHAFKKASYGMPTQFVTMIVDYSNHRVRELVEGKTGAALSESLKEIPGRENVRNVVLDLCDPFKNFAREYFPEARIVADKFHVLRLLNPSIMRRRKEITGTRADLKAKRLLLMNRRRLKYFERTTLMNYLPRHPDLFEVYTWKERLSSFYRIKGYYKASVTLRKLTDHMAFSSLKEVHTLRRTLIKWREEILNYFLTGLTNARTEGYNNKAKVVKRRAYGYRSFRNYRLKVVLVS